tara:strand:- start:17 stop:181 length:165 start_codon:yes stop_codon:yes gene_type:complete
MKTENLNSVIQIINSMELLASELENALESNNMRKIKKIKGEILTLQKQINRIIK